MKDRTEKFFAEKPERFWKDELSKMESMKDRERLRMYIESKCTSAIQY